MPRKSGQSGNRSFGLDHQNGKGDASRITDLKAFRENFENINWGHRVIAILHKRAETEKDEFDWRMGL